MKITAEPASRLDLHVASVPPFRQRSDKLVDLALDGLVPQECPVVQFPKCSLNSATCGSGVLLSRVVLNRRPDELLVCADIVTSAGDRGKQD